MLQAGKVALGQLSVGGSEKLVAIKPCGKGLLLETLRYADEVRKGQAFFAEIDDAKPKKKLLDLPKTLIEQKSALFDSSSSTRRPSRSQQGNYRGHGRRPIRSWPPPCLTD